MSNNDTIDLPKEKYATLKRRIIDNKLTCSRCNYALNVSEFYKDSNTSTGYRGACKSCSDGYRKHKESSGNIGVTGIYFNICAYNMCKKGFITKTKTKVFCSNKCRKREWYEKNEQKSV